MNRTTDVRNAPGAPPSPSAPVRPSFREVFEAHADYVWRTLGHLGVPSSDVADVSQEVFVVVHCRLPEWEPRHPIRTWLYAICRNQARDRSARAHVRRERATEEIPDRADTVTPHDEVDARQALERLHAALGGLDREQREVFLMYELEGVSMEDIADAMGCPVKTAYSRLRLARVRVERAILQAGGESHV
jgi:RNA polymerase sigma-70 factor (ECF subfamily)